MMESIWGHAMILEHAGFVLFGWVFANQVGLLRVPVVPALLAAGALAANGHLRMTEVIVVAVVASLGADLAWYCLGRWRGSQALTVLGRLSPKSGLLVGRARRAFDAHVAPFQLGARFLPELNAIAAGLAGAAKLSVSRFLFCGATSAVVWAGLWIGAGHFIGHAVTETAARFDIQLLVPFLATFLFYLQFQRLRRHRMIRAFRQVSTGPRDLYVSPSGATAMNASRL